MLAVTFKTSRLPVVVMLLVVLISPLTVPKILPPLIFAVVVILLSELIAVVMLSKLSTNAAFALAFVKYKLVPSAKSLVLVGIAYSVLPSLLNFQASAGSSHLM